MLYYNCLTCRLILLLAGVNILRFGSAACRTLTRFKTLLRFRAPVAGVDEGVEPRRNGVVAALCGVIAALPWEDSALRMRHERQMATVVRADAGDRTRRTVRIGRIGVVVVARYDVILRLVVWETELAFAMSHPCPYFATAQRTEHH